MKRSQESRLPESAGGKGDGSDRARGNPPNPTLRGSASSEAAIIAPSLIHGKAIALFFRSGYRDTNTRLKERLLVESAFRFGIGFLRFTVMALLRTTDASGRQGEYQLNSQAPCMIGRAPDNQIVLDDPRASRHHALIKSTDDGSFMIIDGVMVNGQIKRSANHVFVNGEQRFEHPLKDGDRVTIGASTIRFEQPQDERTADLSYDDKQLEAHARKMTIGRTITRKVMKDKVALLSQDAAADEQFAGVDSIVSQGVRSTICAPLFTESGVHGALYADRLDPFSAFKPDDLELISAVAAQTAIAVENVRAHERLAKEEVARANYSRFLPEYVVKQMLENPNSFKLGGVTQTITVLFADIRGFTRISEHAPPEKIVQLLNRYFSAMTDIIIPHGGTLDKYLGDGMR